ncbi:MAG: universal stress protein [Alphaproteobacteria bacterium]|nr:universal stress protein [Alphaproteobacteria bacterium]
MYKNILLAIDLGDPDSWSKSLPISVEFAQTFGATLRVMTVVPDFGMSIVGSFFPKDYETKVLEKARQTLHDFVDQHVPKGIKVQHIVGHGAVYDEILRAADEVSADLIVLGASRPRAGKYLLGPNAGRVVRDAECCVHVVRN